MMQKLLRLPDLLWRKVERQPVSLRTLADARAAIAIAILPFAPLRIANLSGLAFGVSIFVPEREDQPTLIELPGSEMKNGQPYSIELPAHLTKMLRRYQGQLLKPLLGRKSAYVFDTGHGPSKWSSSLSGLIQRTIRRHLGIQMTAHQFRHLMAELIIAQDTSAASFEMARQLLGHRNLSTTMNFYAQQNTLRAGRRHAKMLEEQMARPRQKPRARATKLTTPRSGPKGGKTS
jgi:integrase